MNTRAEEHVYLDTVTSEHTTERKTTATIIKQGSPSPGVLGVRRTPYINPFPKCVYNSMI